MISPSIEKKILMLLLICYFIFISTANSDRKLEKCLTRPNIIFIVADDSGWNDFSFHGSSQIPTPNIDALALNGIILNNYYASPLCTPSRGAILTGKHPIHIKLQHFVITGGMIDGLPLEEKLLPQYLKELNYSTHLVGKWHLGHAQKEYTPTYRGFDSHYGNWLGAMDYYDHFYRESLGFGYDFRSNMTVNYDDFGKYATDLYTKEAVRLIESHPTNQPLFLQINHIAPHTGNDYHPLQAPSQNVDKFRHIEFMPRRLYAGMVDKLDESIGEVVRVLGEKGMLESSIIVFTSDNGGSPEGHGRNYGSNWPLRGVKNSLWEGGIRVAGFIWSPLLPNYVSKDLMHLSDWLPTLYEAVGEDPNNLVNIDGISQWQTLSQANVQNKREEVLHNIDDIYNNSAIRYGPWKVIQGNVTNFDLGATFHWDSWYGPSGRNENKSLSDLIPTIIESEAGKALTSIGIKLDQSNMELIQAAANVECDFDASLKRECDPYNTPCLFNIENDPCELDNKAEDEPSILKKLLDLIKEYNKTATTPLLRYNYPQAAPRFWGNTWTNWNDFSNS